MRRSFQDPPYIINKKFPDVIRSPSLSIYLSKTGVKQTEYTDNTIISPKFLEIIQKKFQVMIKFLSREVIRKHHTYQADSCHDDKLPQAHASGKHTCLSQMNLHRNINNFLQRRTRTRCRVVFANDLNTFSKKHLVSFQPHYHSMFLFL